MVTSLLDMDPVTSDTLNMVINHIESSISKCSCKKDIINLNFVYGATHSRNNFLQVCILLSVLYCYRYHLIFLFLCLIRTFGNYQ